MVHSTNAARFNPCLNRHRRCKAQIRRIGHLHKAAAVEVKCLADETGAGRATRLERARVAVSRVIRISLRSPPTHEASRRRDTRGRARGYCQQSVGAENKTKSIG